MSEHAVLAGHPLLALILASAIVMGSPGPATISVTAIGAAFGLRRSLGYLGGIILGTIAVLLAVAVGIVAMLLSLPRVAPVLIAASAAYMLYLAWRIATRAPPLTRHGPQTRRPVLRRRVSCSASPIPRPMWRSPRSSRARTLAAGDPALDAALKTAVLAVMIVVIHVCWLLAGTAFSRVLYDPVASRIVNVVFALALVATVGLAFVR